MKTKELQGWAIPYSFSPNLFTLCTLQMIQRKEETDGDRYYASVLFYSYE